MTTPSSSNVLADFFWALMELLRNLPRLFLLPPLPKFWDRDEADSPPVAAFSYVPLAGSPLSVQFTDASTGVVSSHYWSFGDGLFSTVKNPLHAYATPGAYAVSLTVTNSAGENTATMSVVVQEDGALAPVADFSFVINGLDVTFTNLSENYTSSSWAFGDGAPSQLAHPMHSYFPGGTYTVTLTVTGPGGTDSISQTLSVTAPIGQVVADFLWFPGATGGSGAGTPQGYFPGWTSVLFANASENADQVEWDFGDGFSSAIPSITHIFPASGSYRVRLTAIGPGGVDVTEQDVLIPVQPAGLVADVFVWQVITGSRQVYFTNRSVGFTTYSLDFGDGTSPTTTGLAIHAYAQDGVYQATVTVTDGLGGIDRKVVNVVSGAGGPLVPPVTADFTAVVVGDTVTLTERSTGRVVDYAWDFGDGSTSTFQRNPAPRAYAPGTYTITLTVTAISGYADSASFTFSVVGPPPPPITAQFTATPDPGNGLFVTFQDTSFASVSILGRLWNFGNGFTSQNGTQLVQYNLPGVYHVTLTVFGTGGVTGFAEADVEVFMTPPQAAFSWNGLAGQSPTIVKFNNESVVPSGQGFSSRWDFGDGSAPNFESHPVHNFQVAGVYPVTLTASNAGGTTSIMQDVTVPVPLI